tara:strand:- start:165 stop:491 length:327 start_codon:yes stop_codon:yes gene_type:complete
MNKIVLSVVGIAAFTMTVAAAAIPSDCGYDSDGNFRLGNGQVASHSTWEHAAACAHKGILPPIVAERLGRWGTLGERVEANYLRSVNTRIQEEKRKREVEVQPLPLIK